MNGNTFIELTVFVFILNPIEASDHNDETNALFNSEPKPIHTDDCLGRLDTHQIQIMTDVDKLLGNPISADTEQHQTSIKNLLQNFRSHYQMFLEDSNHAASGISLGTSVFRRGKPSFYEVRSDKYYRLLLRDIQNLHDQFGFPLEQVTLLRHLVFEGINGNNKKLREGVAQVEKAAIAIAMAPLLYPMIATASTASLISMGVSAGLSSTGIMGNAAINSFYHGTGPLCELSREIADRGPQSLQDLIVFGLIGRIAGLEKAPILLKILSQYYLNFKTAQSIVGGVKTYFTSRELSQLAKNARSEGDENLAREFEALATQARFSVAHQIATAGVINQLNTYLNSSNTSAGKSTQSSTKLKSYVVPIKERERE